MTSKNELISALKSGIVNISIIKKDGSPRVITGTLVESFLPEKETKQKMVNRPEDMVSVWSIPDEGWRGFHIDQVTSWDRVDS